MSSWKRRNNAKLQGEPKIKKVRQVVKKLSSSGDTKASDTEDNNGDAAFVDNNDSQEHTMPLFDFTSPKRLFQSLIQPTEFNVFFNGFWEEKPLVLHRHKSLNHEQLAALVELFSKKTLLQLAKQHEMHFTKDLNALRYRECKREDLNDVGRITATKLNKLFDKDKATVQVHQPQRFQDDLWQIMEYLESFFGTLVGANVYITPGGSQGLCPHHDDVEVFILQLEGQKHWRLYNPLEELPRSYSIDLTQQDIGEPTHDLLLEPGDLLYFPRGTIHQADTPEGVSHSTHITFSTYQHHCWGDYMMSVFPHLLQEAMNCDVSFRRGLPINFIKSTKLSQTNKVQSVMGLLLQKLSTIKPPNFVAPENMIEDFMRSRLPPYLVGGQELRDSLPSGKPPDLGSKVRLRHPDHICFVVRKNEVPVEEEGSEEEEEEEEEEESDEEGGSKELNQSGASSAQFLSRSLMTAPDDDALYVFSSIFNDHCTHMMDASAHDDHSGFALRFPKYYLDCLNQLKGSCDQFTPVSKLNLPGDSDKENVIRALWSSHLLEVIPGAGTKSKAGRKSTKVD